MNPKPKSAAETVVLELTDALCHEDIGGMLACLASDFVRYGEETGWKAMSKQGYREFAENFKQGFSNWKWEILDMVSDGKTVAVDLMESATLSRPWPLRGRVIQPNNKTYHTRVNIFFKINDRGLISSYTNLHDNDFMQCYGHLLETPSIESAIPAVS